MAGFSNSSTSSTLACVLLVAVGLTQAAVHWNDFRVTFKMIGGFTHMPRLEREAVAAGWVQVPALNCFNSGAYNGIRYRMPGDNSVILMYDVKGVIAGIQMWVPQNDLLSNSNNTFRYGAVPYFNNATLDGQNYFVLTSYFVDPNTICTTGRNETELETVGTGIGVWVQAGPTAMTTLRIPQRREDALSTGWSDNNCFPMMGTHSWYRMEDYNATNCNEAVPVFGVWNRQMILHGFGFSMSGISENPHFENPPAAAGDLIAGAPAPPCLRESTELVGKTTMHVYFIDSPRLIVC